MLFRTVSRPRLFARMHYFAAQTRLQTVLDDCSHLHARLIELQEATRHALLKEGRAREGAVPPD